MIVASNSPDENKWISDEEMHYITATLPHTPGRAKGQKHAPVPWRRLATSTVLLSNLVAQFSFNFSSTMMQSFLPAYFRDVLLLDLKSNGLYTVLPYLSQLIFKNVFGNLSDYLKRQGYLSPTVSSKLFQSLGSFGTATCFTGLALFVDCERPTLALTLLGLCFSSGMSGFYISLISIAPIYTGGSQEEWRNVYLICAVVNLIAGVLFLIFGSDKPQRNQVVDIPLPIQKRRRTVSEMSSNDWTV
ncbi:hypothetical protein L596_030129 [Steinernema carpocapsae]|uniref:Major facilitator superfamily (MFS) profile domain-containing protein n=1 Tax=Steinernema carpocapsae TaxID=34508 RepID=A0A4U5LRT5_STECR|nr:hypothetical protein L596_030129 [Steinernema carpocapsae]